MTVHSATLDFSSRFRRHAVRLTPQAEPPTEGETKASSIFMRNSQKFVIFIVCKILSFSILSTFSIVNPSII